MNLVQDLESNYIVLPIIFWEIDWMRKSVPTILILRPGMRFHLYHRTLWLRMFIVPGETLEEIIDFVLDRPFLFVITNDNIPLFAGCVNNPEN